MINDNGQPRADIHELMNLEQLSDATIEGKDSLSAGDRIQIREYIFEVIQEWNIRDKQIIKCTNKIWKVYHGRIVVEADEEEKKRFHAGTWFPIPRTVELLQWSASTDIYRLVFGTLFSLQIVCCGIRA
ncbi:MAG: hypothetical protein R2911_42665 [Caldilineaceae bacterium]